MEGFFPICRTGRIWLGPFGFARGCCCTSGLGGSSAVLGLHRLLVTGVILGSLGSLRVTSSCPGDRRPRGQESSPPRDPSPQGWKERASPQCPVSFRACGRWQQGLVVFPPAAVLRSDLIPQLSKETMMVAVASTVSCPLVSPPSGHFPGLFCSPGRPVPREGQG